jgi:hypothetical protein
MNTWIKRLEKPIASLLLTVGLAATSGTAWSANRSDAVTRPAPLAPQESLIITDEAPLADGVYFYGQSAQRDQVGSAYMVVEVNQGEMVGAFYMPRSSFDCFQGRVENNQLSLSIVDTYTKQAHPLTLALETNAAIASNSNQAIAPATIQGYQRLNSINDDDRRYLATCKADLER